ncbi:DUF1257 domain-containing protein (plasmid) [Rhizobium bangladeshense]|uniref:DUF1257 domain-containing protein n=1 Tax=Rhizobium bangladeshense TaxID=1138189 RepID=UPI001A99D058|nr:DUF1257 domain-containing protein [Rhizobium bangladeshense]QSY98672.1 DUF1257 domain-containing protein [Rhizobium bangladeshense]
MSHTTKISGLAIKDVSAMHAAVRKLNNQGVRCELVENAKPRMYYDNQLIRHGYKKAEADLCLKLTDGEYDIGFMKQADGSYAPVFDEHANYVGRILGAGASCPMPHTAEGRAQHQMGKFMQAYAVEAATNAAISRGYIVESADIDQTGAVQLVLSGM